MEPKITIKLTHMYIPPELLDRKNEVEDAFDDWYRTEEEGMHRVIKDPLMREAMKIFAKTGFYNGFLKAMESID